MTAIADRTTETNAEYHADTSRVSNSMLTELKRSPKRCYRRFIAKTMQPENTKPLVLGDLVHGLVLEPAKVPERYAVAPKVDKRTTVGKDTWREFQEFAGGKTIVEQDVYKQAVSVAASLLEHELAKVLLSTPGIIEQRIDFEWSSVPCRCKPDLLLVDASLIVDVKTCKDASPDGFAKSVANYGYARQAAFYLEAARQKYGKPFSFVFVVVATQEPYEAACYELSADTLAIGEAEIEALVSDYVKRTRTGNWEAAWSCGSKPVMLDLPKYYRSKVFEDDTEEEDEE